VPIEPSSSAANVSHRVERGIVERIVEPAAQLGAHVPAARRRRPQQRQQPFNADHPTERDPSPKCILMGFPRLQPARERVRPTGGFSNRAVGSGRERPEPLSSGSTPGHPMKTAEKILGEVVEKRGPPFDV
jgi:hypothetical protein